MMDILACPIDKNHPLELFAINENSDVVSEGVLFCTKCSRFYPVMDNIPIMLPDDLRDKQQEIKFLKENKAKLPEKIIINGKPWHL